MIEILKIIAFLTTAFISQLVLASDEVPYSAKSIKNVGSGYVELIEPGKIKYKDTVAQFRGTIYIRINNIGTMVSVDGARKGCILSYSSEGYTENINVTDQSCKEILSVINDK